MAIPVYVLAGQSNAQGIDDALQRALDQKHGVDGYILVETYAAGAPLTYKRSKLDWAANDELRQDLVTDTVEALASDQDAYLEKVFWLQGEADTHSVGRADEYEGRFSEVIDGFRQAVQQAFPHRETGVETAHVVIVGLSGNAPEAEDRENWEAVTAAQHALAANNALFDLVDPDGVAALNGVSGADMFRDGLHFSDGFRDLLADALVDLDLPAGGNSGRGDFIGTAFGDVLFGTSGGERMIGGSGDDVYHVNHAGDIVVELSEAGNDRVISSRDFTLRFHSQYLEDLKLTGRADLNGTGNGLDNRIVGNKGDNILKGAWGDDVLIGGKGNDTFIDEIGMNRMIGGQGDDLYVFKSSGNRIVEQAKGGIDHVRASIDVDLGDYSAHLENLSLIGAENIDGFGNGRANTIVGNNARNILNGKGGNDSLVGNGGRDILRGHKGDDSLEGGAGRDRFVFRAQDGQDQILDFTPDIDVLVFSDGLSFDALVIREEACNTIISYGNQDQVVLVDVSFDTLDQHDFVFV
ncbi:sialate O-acetylesterase [Arenibacterium sp. CAU 1754]